jgi:hypothetical protein
MGFLDVLSSIFGGGSALGTGLQQERDRSNESADSRGRTLANIYGSQLGAQTGIYGSQANQQTSQYNTQQQAALQALLGASNEAQQNARTDLDRRTFALNAPNTRATQATRGSLLQSLQPATISGGSSRLQAHTPTISGGFNDPLGPGAREAGRLLEQGALAGLKSGDTFDPLPKTDFQGGVLKPPGILAAPTMLPAPNLPAYQGAGGLESLLGALGLGKPIIDAILKKRNVPGSGVGDPEWQGPIQDPPEWQGPLQEPPEWQGPIDEGPTGETSARFYVDPMNMDPYNPYTFGGGVDTTPPDFNWEW